MRQTFHLPFDWLDRTDFRQATHRRGSISYQGLFAHREKPPSTAMSVPIHPDKPSLYASMDEFATQNAESNSDFYGPPSAACVR
jgi:hypothetical protein